MRTWQAVITAAVFFAGILPCCTNPSYTIERSTVNGLPTVVATENATAQAKVAAVDYYDRSIALEGPKGETNIFHVTSAVRNFYQIKKGDTVNVSYSSRVAVSVHQVSDPPSATVVDSAQLAELGQKPGILCTRNARVEATVTGINYETRDVRMKTATGGEIALTADKRLKNLENVKIGDQVVFEYTEALSIKVD
jgi:hypothetical protein